MMNTIEGDFLDPEDDDTVDENEPLTGLQHRHAPKKSPVRQDIDDNLARMEAAIAGLSISAPRKQVRAQMSVADVMPTKWLAVAVVLIAIEAVCAAAWTLA